MDFRVRGLEIDQFRAYFDMADRELAAVGVIRQVVVTAGACPDRVELVDAQPGERVLLLNYMHQAAATPYRSCHAIFVRETAVASYDRVNDVGPSLRTRVLSLRLFDNAHRLIDADLVDGAMIEAAITRLFDHPCASYIQAHYAKHGCYAARIEPL